MGFNLTGTQVKNTYQKLAQISGSVLTNGTGSVITNLNVIASNATNATNAVNATYAISASYAAYAVSASHEIIKEVSSSYADTAGVANSVAYSVITGKPTLVSGSAQIVIGSTTGNLSGSRVIGAVAGTIAYSNVTGKPTLISGSAQIAALGFATTGSNTFIGGQTIQGNVTFVSSSFISSTNESGSIYVSALNGGVLHLNDDGGEGDIIIGNGINKTTLQGNVTIEEILTVTNIQGTGSLSLKPNKDDNRDLVIYNTAPSDIHIASTSTPYVFFGDDTNYLKIDQPAGQISIEATDEVYLTTDTSVIGDLHVSGTFYPNIVNFFSSSIAQSTGSYVLTTSNAGVVQYDTYQKVAEAVQSDIQINRLSGDLSGSRIGGAVASAVSASHAIIADTAGSSSTAVSASYATNATNAINAQDILLYVRNTSGAIIAKGRVVRINGATGDTPEINLAEPTTDRLSANAIGLTNEQIAINGFGYVMTAGRLIGVNTNAFIPGTLLYLAAGGTYSSTPQTAPNHTVRLGEVLRQNTNNGSIYIKVDNGYELNELHDVLISYPSASGDLLQFDGTVWRNSQNLTGTYNFGGNQTFSGITATGNVIVTGSVTANGGFVGNATSATTATTASYVTGQENYARKDQANTFTQRNTFNSGINLTGSLTFNSANIYEGIDLFQGVYPGPGAYSTPIRFYSGSRKDPDFYANKWINLQTAPGNVAELTFSSFPENEHFLFLQPAYCSPTGKTRTAFEQPIGGYYDDIFVDTSIQITGSLKTRTTSPSSNVSIGMINITGSSLVNVAPFSTSTQRFSNTRFGFVNQVSRGTPYRNAFATENWNNTTYDNTTFGTGLYANGRTITLEVAPSGSATPTFANRASITVGQAAAGATSAVMNANTISLGANPSVSTTAISIGNASLATLTMTAISGSFSGVTNARLNNVRVNGTLNVNGNTALTGTLTVANKTTFNDQVVGSVATITPAAGVGTLDCSLGNFFTVTLVAGTDTVLTPTNIHAGQTINVRVTQNATTAGTISFPASVQFADGIDYVATTSLNAIDVLTLISFDGTTLQATAVKNLQ
jgi:hypothetical protein